MKPISLQRQNVQGVQTHRYKNGRMLIPARFIKDVQPVWSTTVTTRGVTGHDYEDHYHFASLEDAVRYLTIMAKGDHQITDATWQTLATQLPPRKVKEIEEATGQRSTADTPPQQGALV